MYLGFVCPRARAPNGGTNEEGHKSDHPRGRSRHAHAADLPCRPQGNAPHHGLSRHLLPGQGSCRQRHHRRAHHHGARQDPDGGIFRLLARVRRRPCKEGTRRRPRCPARGMRSCQRLFSAAERAARARARRPAREEFHRRRAVCRAVRRRHHLQREARHPPADGHL